MQQKYGTRFVTLLLPGFTKKLLMPNEIVKNIGTDDARKVATIVTSGKIWHVKFYRDGEDYCIGGKGWMNFVGAHGLKDGGMLVFRYRGNMVFSLRIFDDTTCCEKIYPYGSRMGAGENPIFSDHDNDENLSVVREPTKSCKKRKVQDTTISEDTTIGLSQDEVPAESEENCSIKFSFETTIEAHHLSRQRLFMDIPYEFIQSFGREHGGEFMLCDPQGQTWHVGLSKCKLSGAYISKGWLGFARGNKLKEGDRCIFELSAPPSQQQQRKKGLINVRILSCAPVPNIDQTCRMPKSAPEDSESPEKTMTRGAHFEVTISIAQLSRYCLYVPKSFKAATCLEKLSRVVLIDPKLRRWSFGLLHIRSKGNTITYLTRRWRPFVVGNRLQGGDKCIFELLPEGSSSSIVIRVQILRTKKHK